MIAMSDVLLKIQLGPKALYSRMQQQSFCFPLDTTKFLPPAINRRCAKLNVLLELIIIGQTISACSKNCSAYETSFTLVRRLCYCAKNFTTPLLPVICVLFFVKRFKIS